MGLSIYRGDCTHPADSIKAMGKRIRVRNTTHVDVMCQDCGSMRHEMISADGKFVVGNWIAK